MKAVQITRYGGPEVLEVKENVPQPSPQKGQVLVEIHAAGLNPFDAKLRSGMMKAMIPLQFPVTAGGDFAGVVTQVGPPAGGDVSDFKVGDEVYGTAIVLSGGSGAYAEIAAANIANSAHKPKTVTFEEAAALPVVGCSTVQALEEYMKLTKRQRILVHGGAGGSVI